VDSGDVAPLYMFYNGPASNSFNSGRFSFYGVSSTPTVKFDGQAYGWSPNGYPGSIADRLAEPCHLGIVADPIGNASGGTAYFTFTAEEDLNPSGPLRAYAVIVEDHDIAGNSWGGYTGQEMMWLPVSFPLGTGGTVIEFSGGYPDTVYAEGSYDLKPTEHTFDNLRLVTWVQETSGSREVMNAHYMDMPDSPTGVYDTPWGDGASQAGLVVGPNPGTGTLSISAILPEGVCGSVGIYDMQGRLVESLPAGIQTSAEIEEPGVYFVRLSTSSGEVVTRQCTVLR
jgi:hypothetical protein